MASSNVEIITKYDALYAVRTGLTILVPKLKAFDGGIEVPAHFRVSPDSPRDVLITADGKSAVLKDLRKEYLDAAIDRKMIMFYEMNGEDIVRCTPCSYAAR